MIVGQLIVGQMSVEQLIVGQMIVGQRIYDLRENSKWTWLEMIGKRTEFLPSTQIF